MVRQQCRHDLMVRQQCRHDLMVRQQCRHDLMVRQQCRHDLMVRQQCRHERWHSVGRDLVEGKTVLQKSVKIANNVTMKLQQLLVYKMFLGCKLKRCFVNCHLTFCRQQMPLVFQVFGHIWNDMFCSPLKRLKCPCVQVCEGHQRCMQVCCVVIAAGFEQSGFTAVVSARSGRSGWFFPTDSWVLVVVTSRHT